MIKIIFILNAIFYFPMWISKTLHPIYWESTGKIELFSVSYVAMALVGSFAFIYVGIIRKCSLPISLAIGFFLYSLGLILRAFPINIETALISGITAGIGASIVGLALKRLIIEIDVTVRDKVILHSNNIFTISQSLGAVLSGALVSIVGIFSTDSYQIALLITGFLTMSSFLFIPWKTEFSCSDFNVKSSTASSTVTTVDFIVSHKSLFFYAFLSMFVLGVSSAIILPLIPIFMKKIGFSINKIGFILFLGVVTGFILKNTYIYLFSNTRKKTLDLLFFSISSSISIYFSFFCFTMKWTLAYAVMIILFYTFRTINSLLIEIIEMSIVDKKNLMIFFGITQTSFLLGDIIGGGMMPILYKKNILTHYPFILSLFIILGTVLFILCTKSSDLRKAYAAE
ncbi:MAG: MFS transporter [Candidatus Symbiodolus clandestinus]